MSKVATTMPPVAAGDLYESDFFQWTQTTAEQLRRRRLAEADLDHAAEEIEDMGKRELKELNSRTQVLVARLLKWQLQPEKRSRSWQATIVTLRLEIEALLSQSPSLRTRFDGELERNYAGAVKRAVAETGIAFSEFPSSCPFVAAQILDEEFLPG